jgi:hypothetical protein
MLGTFVGKFAFDYEINEWYEFVETHWKKVDRNVVTRDMCRYILTNPNEFLRKIASSSLSPFIEENISSKTTCKVVLLLMRYLFL